MLASRVVFSNILLLFALVHISSSIIVNNKHILEQAHVHIKDNDAVSRKIEKMIADGFSKLQVVSDFDRTLTKQHLDDGTAIAGSFGIFENIDEVPDNYRELNKQSFEKYYPLEVNLDLPLQQRKHYVKEWIHQSEKNLYGLSVTKKDILRAAEKYKSMMRDRSKVLFDKLMSADVPILVLSAGIGDVVEALLEVKHMMLPDVKVISNFLKYKNFNGKLIIVGFKTKPLINVYNKHEIGAVENYYKSLQDRKNIILMGDSLGDTSMADRAQSAETVLRIGFLYGKIEEALPKFKDAFDIVIVDDQSMDVLLEITEAIENKN